MGTVYHTAVFGGMNEATAPDLLDAKTAAKLVNAEIVNGKVCSIHGIKKSTYESWETAGCYKTPNRSVVKWYGRTYWSDNRAGSHEYGGNLENFLGIQYPASSPVVVTESPATGVTGLTGKYKYCITYVSGNGWESAPGAEGSTYYTSVEPSDQVCKISAPSTFPSNITGVKVYRTSDEGADFFHVGTITTAGGTFTDSTSDDTLLLLNPMDSIDNYPPPSGGRYLSEYSGIFYLAFGTRVYFSVQNNPHAWPTLNFLGFDDTVTGICPEFQGVLVFTRNRTYRVTGDSSETMVKTLLPAQQGCVSFRTISHVLNAPVWLSNDGICLWDGENIEIVSQNIINADYRHISDLSIYWSETANDMYYLFLGDASGTKKTIIFDRRNGDVFLELNTAYEFAWYSPDKDKFYVDVDSQLYEFNHKEAELLKYEWESPMTGGDSIVMKQFSEMYIEIGSIGDETPYAELYLYPDGENSGGMLAKVSGSGRHRIKFPYPTECRKMQIKIKGKGSLNEILVNSR